MNSDNLIQFLIDNPVNDVKSEVIVSERLKNFPFTIRAMTSPEHQNYQNIALAIGKRGKTNFDSKKFNEMVILNHVTNPDFKNAETISKAGCVTPEQFLYKSLLAGEISELVVKISELSGFDKDEAQLINEVKND